MPGGISQEKRQSFAESGGMVAAGLGYNELGLFHAAIIYRHHRVVKCLHLGWENRLYWQRGIAFAEDIVWASPRSIPDMLAKQVVARCEMIVRKFKTEKKLPYSINWFGSYFDSNGVLKKAHEARGLTCATFILAVLASLGVFVLNEKTWERRPKDDRAWLDTIEATMKERGMKVPAHLGILRNEVASGALRIRPEEVICAVDIAPPLAEFKPTAEMAGQLKAAMDRQRRRG